MSLNKDSHAALQGSGPWLFVLAGLFLCSFTLLLFKTVEVEKMLFYFPDDTGQAVHGEYRILSRRRGLSDRLSGYIHEYILGPVNFRSSSIFTKDARLAGLFYRKRGELIVNWRSTALKRPGEMRLGEKNLNFKEALDLVESGIKINFPRVKTVRFLVEGQELSIEPYSPP